MRSFDDARCGDKTCYRGTYGLGQGYLFKDGPCDALTASGRKICRRACTSLIRPAPRSATPARKH